MIEALKHAFPAEIQALCQRIRSAAFESYVVGGAIRDLLLNKNLSDIDMCSDAKPDEIKALFPTAIPTGKAFGTMSIPIHLKNKKQFVQITTFRSEACYDNQRHPQQITFERDILKDLQRRDFTINALAYDPLTHHLIDAHQGLADLKAKTIRTVGEAPQRFKEDSLRLFRACRFAAQLGFECHPETANALANCAKSAKLPAKERITEELNKLLHSPYPFLGLKYLKASGLGERILPGFQQISLKHLQNIQDSPLHLRWAKCLMHFPLDTCFLSLSLAKKEQSQIRKLIAYDFDETKAGFSIKDLAISGQELQDMGYAGREIGSLQKKLFKHIIQDLRLNTRDECLHFIDTFKTK